MSECKRCPGCGPDKPLDQFGRDGSRRDGLRSRCLDCNREDCRRRRKTDPEAKRATRRRQYATNSQPVREASRRWREANPDVVRERKRDYRTANRDAVLAADRRRARRRHAANRKAVFDHYGRACACCGSTEKPTIDHVNGDGKAHRAEIGGASRMYSWLIANGFPEGFQVLCGPCNRSKGNGNRCRLDHAAVLAEEIRGRRPRGLDAEADYGTGM